MSTMNLDVIVKLVDQASSPAKGLLKTIQDIERAVRRFDSGSMFGSMVRGAERAAGQVRNIDNALMQVQSRANSVRQALGGIAPSSGGINNFANTANSGLKQLHGTINSIKSQLSQLHNQLGKGVTVPAPKVAPAHAPTGTNTVSGVVAPAVTGYALARGAGYVGTQAGDLTQSALKMELAGMSGAEIAKVQAVGWQLTQKYKNFSSSLIQNSILEVRSVYGSTEEAIAGIEAALKAATVLRTQLKGKMNAEQITNEVFSLFKSADLRNVTDSPQETERFIDNMTKVITATGGKIAPRDFLQMLKYGKTGTQFWNDEFITRIAASVMQEANPSTVGTALTSLYQNVIAGRMQKKEAVLFDQLGLLDKSKVVWNKAGDVKGVLPGGVAGSELFKTNPYEWVQKILKPALEADLRKKGMDPKGLSDEQFNQAVMPTIAGMFGNRNADWIANTLMKNRPIERDKALIDQATGIAGAQTIQNKDLFTAWESFTTQFNNLLAAAASPLVPTAVSILNGLASAMGSFAAVLTANPTLATIGTVLVATAGGLAALAVAIRTVSTALAIARASMFLTGLGAGAAAGGAGAGVGAGLAAGAAGGGLASRLFGWGGKLLRGAGWVGGALLAKEGLEYVDPKGNLGGLTTPVDRWTQDKWGFNLAGQTLQQLFPERYPALNEPGGTIAPPPMKPGTLEAAANVNQAVKVANDLKTLVSQAQGLVAQPVTTDTVNQLTNIKAQVEQAKAALTQIQAGPTSPGSNVWVGMANKAMSDLDFALSSVQIKLDSMKQMGQPAGQGLMDTTASGIQAGAPGVVAQAQAVMNQIKAIFQSGVDVPIRVQPQINGAAPTGAAPTTGSLDAGVKKSAAYTPAATSAGGTSRSTNVQVGGITVNAAPGMDPRQVADAVDQRFRDAVGKQMNDGVYA